MRGKDAGEREALAEIETTSRNPEWNPTDGGVVIGVAYRAEEGAIPVRKYEDYADLMADMCAPLSDLTEQWEKMSDALLSKMLGVGSATHEEFHKMRKRSMVKWAVIELHRRGIRPSPEKYREIRAEFAKDGLLEYDRGRYGECECRGGFGVGDIWIGERGMLSAVTGAHM